MSTKYTNMNSRQEHFSLIQGRDQPLLELTVEPDLNPLLSKTRRNPREISSVTCVIKHLMSKITSTFTMLTTMDLLNDYQQSSSHSLTTLKDTQETNFTSLNF